MGETKTDVQISKWWLRIAVGVAGVIFLGFTYLYGQVEKVKDSTVPIKMFQKFDEDHTESHDKLESEIEKLNNKQEKFNEKQQDTNLTVKRIETILEERLN